MRSSLLVVGALGLGILSLSALCSELGGISLVEPRCLPPPAGFTEADLVGTWMAGWPEHSDVLTIRSDGTYRQDVHVELAEGPSIRYKGEWKPWRSEYSEDGIAYLHLDSYRFCGLNPSISCQVTDGDGYDFCRHKWVLMEGEGILLVLGTNTRGTDEGGEVYYYLHYPLGSEESWVYALQGP